MAGRHEISDPLYRPGVRGRRLWMGFVWPQHHRPLLSVLGGNEQLGCSSRHDPDFTMGRSLEKLPHSQTASRLCPRPTYAGGDSELLLELKNEEKSSNSDELIFRISHGVPHKCQDVRFGLDDFAHRFARSMSGLRFDPNKHRISAFLCGLQSCGKLERVTWHHSIVMISRGHQSRRITRSAFYVLQRRILDQVPKPVRGVRRSIIGFPCPSDGKFLEPQHIENTKRCDRCP